jgi:isopentenyldiphosphate isomerase
LVERYAPYLRSYAALRRYHYQSGIEKKKSVELHVIELFLYHAVERGIEQMYGEGITVMLAMAREKIVTDDLIEQLERHRLIRKEATGQPYQPILRPEPQQRMQEIVAWFVKHHTQEASTPDEMEAMQRKYLETLEQLYEQWDHLPIKYPLASSEHAAQADEASGTDQQRTITSAPDGEEEIHV